MIETFNKKSIMKGLLSSDFKLFLRKAFNTLHPGAEFKDSWHINAMAEAALTLCNGQVNRLIVNMPPRFLKSICFSVALPAWLLGQNPAYKIIVASYSKALSYKHSEDCRAIMKSDWYRELFPKTIINKGSDRVEKFTTSQRGFRFAASVYGTLTGEGADFIVVDDPQTPTQALRENMRSKVIDWFQKTLMSRLNDQRNGKVLIVMQRLHLNDLSGFLLNKCGWSSLSLKARASGNVMMKVGDKVFVRQEGHLLQEDRMSDEDIDQIKNEMGDYAFQSQYQQSPLPLGKGMIKEEWIRRYDYEATKSFEAIYQSWDCAIKSEKLYHDYTVCTTWGERQGKYYLIDVYKEKLDYPYLVSKVMSLASRFSANYVLIEDKASGQPLIQEVKKKSRSFALVGICPKYDKVTRLMLASPFFQKGNIFFPHRASWLSELEEELNNFPEAPHDDQVDSISQFILWKENLLTSEDKRIAKYATEQDMKDWRMTVL